MEPFYRLNIDPQAATDLAEKGATVLMLSVPVGSYVGVDHQAFSAGPKFKGVKMLTPGPHFFATHPVGDGSVSAPPTGFFAHLKPRQVLVKVWDTATEQLLDMSDNDEAERYAEGVRRFEFDSFLAPYDLSRSRRWSGLSNYVTDNLISKLSPVGNNISIIAEAEDPELVHPKTEAERQLVEQLKEGRRRLAERFGNMEDDDTTHAMVHNVSEGVEVEASTRKDSQGDQHTEGEERPLSMEGANPSSSTSLCGWGRCFYTHLPDRLVKRKGLSPAELTAINLDKSLVLITSAHRYDGDLTMLVGELQFAFVAFVYGQSLDGFLQWKSLLVLFLACEEAALGQHQDTFSALLRAVRYQLQVSLIDGKESMLFPGSGRHVPGDAPEGPASIGLPLIEELLPDSFLRKSFGGFFHTLQDNMDRVSNQLHREVQVLKKVLRAGLGWDFDIRILGEDDSEDEDDMPVIVDVNEPYVL
ncbi:hypothetical protein CEUSTIGMA_g7289.t1 [Chlamydomonas eustigma]|uniref:AAR2 splicing factor homolog n=1 Tax=Chlamydomonas eustigma TaxID=1157962 RepID=A0A250XAC6_9CHLO|nr:hypothetical protein CEUSTIGMA_g7289.t1 [Chlamydomonas eustigma]|eukprot:GAX79849.1 hypothetical protein CEUSTIGMA_g7289.t1 [Chlamydomonas eustigma]